MEALQRRIAQLERENTRLRACMDSDCVAAIDTTVQDDSCYRDTPLTIVVIGASGDLARKKTFPALQALHAQGLLPHSTRVFGYARSELNQSEFRSRVEAGLPSGDPSDFLGLLEYCSGSYDSVADLSAMVERIDAVEGRDTPTNRLFYFAIPPSVFAAVAGALKATAMSRSGWNRVVVEKPFGRDLASSRVLSRALLTHYAESQLYRIDHYLGKEMVQALMVVRFANTLLEPLWSGQHIQCVLITFKEDFGTRGRGGYFDQYGILRDVVQNHLLQVLSLVAMEAPVSLAPEDIRNEKVKVLKYIRELTRDRLLLGQYGADPKGSEPAYRDDPGVPDDSVTPTFAQAVLHVDNARWAGVPFVLKAGKALDQRKAEVRVQFKRPASGLYGADLAPNELVLRIQPDEAVYWKLHTKEPGLTSAVKEVELNLQLKDRFSVDVSVLHCMNLCIK